MSINSEEHDILRKISSNSGKRQSVFLSVRSSDRNKGVGFHFFFLSGWLLRCLNSVNMCFKDTEIRREPTQETKASPLLQSSFGSNYPSKSATATLFPPMSQLENILWRRGYEEDREVLIQKKKTNTMIDGLNYNLQMLIFLYFLSYCLDIFVVVAWKHWGLLMYLNQTINLIWWKKKSCLW